MTRSPFLLDCRGRTLDVRPGRPHVMGILNVTPDSFSDGGRYSTVERALARAEEIVREGASIIDIGGESSRPAGSVYGEGARAVSVDEECERVVPVIEGIVARLPDAILSVDTWKPEVAAAALEAGAHIINDITGLRESDELAGVASRFGAPMVVMHSTGRPGAMSHEREDEVDIVEEVTDALRNSIAVAEEAGVRDLVVDAGFGFGKTPQQNLALLAATDELLALNRPVLVGISRKATVGIMLGSREEPTPVDDRLFGTLGATAVACIRGASIVRTHDVAPTVQMLKLFAATLAADPRGYHPPVTVAAP